VSNGFFCDELGGLAMIAQLQFDGICSSTHEKHVTFAVAAWVVQISAPLHNATSASHVLIYCSESHVLAVKQQIRLYADPEQWVVLVFLPQKLRRTNKAAG